MAKAPGPDDLIEIVLVGKVGCGKSSSGNTILGQSAFRTSGGFSTETKTCERVKERVYGRQIALVDTPGLDCEEVSPTDLFREITQITFGIINVFLLVIQLGRFTEEQKAAVQKLEDMFGERVREQTMILFTYGDELNTSIENYIHRAGDPLGQVIQRYGGRYHVFNNKSDDPRQVTELFRKMERVRQNGYYLIELRLERLRGHERQRHHMGLPRRPAEQQREREELPNLDETLRTLRELQGHVAKLQRQHEEHGVELQRHREEQQRREEQKRCPLM